MRVHLTPTAAADSFAGYCLGAAALNRAPSAGAVIGLCGASVLCYWVGMAQNDIFDREKDRTRHPGRPLPRGAISTRSAVLFSVCLGALALLAALSVSRQAAGAALGVMALSLLYNAGGKRVPIAGNLLMGSCRAGNLLLGALGAIGFEELAGERSILLAAGLLGLYIAMVTAVSVIEDRPPRPASFLASALPLLLFPAALPVLPAPPGAEPGGASLLNSAFLLLFLGLAALRGAIAAARAEREPGGLPGPSTAGGPPHPAEGFVRSALGAIFLVDAGLLLARGLRGPALVEYGLMILAWLWRRRWLKSPP